MVKTRSSSKMKEISNAANTRKQTMKTKMKTKITAKKEDDCEKSESKKISETTKKKFGQWLPRTIDYDAFIEYAKIHYYNKENSRGKGGAMLADEVYNAYQEWKDMSQNEKDEYYNMVKKEKARLQKLRDEENGL